MSSPMNARYIAFDLRNRLFTPNQNVDPVRINELASLYAEVFNAVESIPQKWSIEGATQMIRARLKKPGFNIALIDLERDEKIIGAFLSNLNPGANGWTISEADVLLKPEYRSTLGIELTWHGERHANNVCFKNYGEYLVANHCKTYRIPENPKKLWTKVGFDLQPLFVQEARRMTRTDLQIIPGISVEAVEESDLQNLAQFIASHNSTVSSTGEAWSMDRAEKFVAFMYEHNYPTFNVVRYGDDIVAASVCDIMPGRAGASLVDAQCFVRNTNSLRNLGVENATQETLAALSFFEMYSASGGVARHEWRQPLAAIEIPHNSASFFMSILPALQEDEYFLGMTASQGPLIENLKPRSNRRRILLMAGHGPN